MRRVPVPSRQKPVPERLPSLRSHRVNDLKSPDVTPHGAPYRKQGLLDEVAVLPILASRSRPNKKPARQPGATGRVCTPNVHSYTLTTETSRVG